MVPHPARMLCLDLNPSVNLPLQPFFWLLPQSSTLASIPVFFQLFWAAIVSPGRCGGAISKLPCRCRRRHGNQGQLPPSYILKSLPSRWLKAWPQLLNIPMKPVKCYRYVKWAFLPLLAKLLICKITFNGPGPCFAPPSSDLWGWGHLYIFNISWTPWVLDPITNPSLVGGGGAPWLPPVTVWPQKQYLVEKESCRRIPLSLSL